MKISNHIKSLYRSPLKTTLTLLLLAAAAFLFLYNLSEYSVADREYREARDRYEGVLTVEEQIVPDNPTVLDFFLLSDETGRTDKYGKLYVNTGLDLTYENYHQKSLGEDVIKALGSLLHVSRVEKRYLTAGVARNLVRLDSDTHMYPYFARSIITATVKERYQSFLYNGPEVIAKYQPEIDNLEYVTLEAVEVLAGNPDWLQKGYPALVYLQTVKEQYRGEIDLEFGSDYITSRNCMFVTDYFLYPEDSDALQPGRRVLLVLRNSITDQVYGPTTDLEDVYQKGHSPRFEVGDDSLLGWWPYIVDITDLRSNWLETDEFADLRELIRVTEDDTHTFDVVYCDDMAAQRRAAEGRIVCEEGRFITPADAGQPVCVVNEDILNTYGLRVGDTITLDLGNYLSEQYAPLGAVAVTRGRQNTEYTTQVFTIIGSWRDLNEGNHPYRDLFWCWSDNAIFVPTAFLPECRNAEGHSFKPSEVSFVVGNAEDITAFVEECLPLVEDMGLIYQFSDGGWLNVAEDLMRARVLAQVKLLIFAGAAFFALILTVWLFIGRKKREYGILRALGMTQGEASNRLFVPFILLGTLSTLLGLLIARIVTTCQLTRGGAAHVSADLGVFLLGALGFWALLAVMSVIGLTVIRRESILALTQEKQK